MNITITTSTETLQLLEGILHSYEQAIDDHLYRIWSDSSTREAQADLGTARAELNRMIGQAQKQLSVGRPNMTGVRE